MTHKGKDKNKESGLNRNKEEKEKKGKLNCCEEADILIYTKIYLKDHEKLREKIGEKVKRAYDMSRKGVCNAAFKELMKMIYKAMEDLFLG